MTRCTELDQETHDVLRRVTELGVSKRGTAKTTATNLAEEFDVPRKEIRLLLDDLQASGYLNLGQDGRIGVLETCGCVASTSLLDTERGSGVRRGHPRAGRRVGSSQGESPSPYGGGTSPPVRRAEPEVLQTSSTSEETSAADRRSPEPGRLAGPRGVRATREPESAYEMASLLKRGVRAMRWDLGVAWVGGVNHGAVRAEIARWFRDGEASPELVREMIAEFTRTAGWIREGQPAWRSFLANRQALANRAAQRLHEVGPRQDESDWLGSADTPDESEDEWLSW